MCMLCFSLQQHMSIGKIQTLTLLIHQVSLSAIKFLHVHPNMEVGILMSPSLKVQMHGGLPGRGGGGGGYWSLDLSDALKPNYESERGKFLIDFSSFF